MNVTPAVIGGCRRRLRGGGATMALRPPLVVAASIMPAAPLSLAALLAWIGGVPGAGGPPDERSSVAIVDLDLDADVVAAEPAPTLHAGVGMVVVGLTSRSSPEAHPAAAACDLVLDRGDAALAAVIATVERNPIAALAAAVLLRGAEGRSLDDGLMAESAVYSGLQAGPEFAAWRASRPIVERAPGEQPVLLERAGPVLRVTLNRPDVRNAFSTAMRDQLVEAFCLPALDPSIAEVHLRGVGDSFCSGGDLDEFGSFEDPASAHLVRLQQSVGRSIAAVSERVTAHLHGACVGSGIELPAFAHRVLAQPDTVISLPEVSLGLVPGAGGTVSVPRRIGRLRTARLVLSGERIDAGTALAWGLIDALEDSSSR